MLSIIVPTHNEIKNKYIQRSFKSLSQLKNIEVIIVDTNSKDGTIELAKEYNYKVIASNTTSRAKRLNIGIQNATYDYILLHHPRSIIDPKGIKFLIDKKEFTNWGAFTHKFDKNNWFYKFTSFYSNYIRGARGIFYLDHCIFARKDLLLKIGLIPEVDIFEDTDLSLLLRKQAKPKLLPYFSTTSSVRFEKNGFWKQACKNQILKFKYYFKINHKIMNRSYEQGLDLNSDYKKEH